MNILQLRTGLLLVAASILTGCANTYWTTFNKERKFSDKDGDAVFIDAKQRAVISNVITVPAKDIVTTTETISTTPNAVIPNKVTTTTTEKVAEATMRRFCAEPSPDALSAIAASMGLNLSVPSKGDVGYSQAFTEGAASIGLRTQTIQIMRDITYRDCESFINGGLTKFGLETLQRRFQSTLVAVLAIEQLTGVVKAPAVALGGMAKGIDADALAAAIKLVDTAEAAASAAKDAYDATDKASTTSEQAFVDFQKANPNVKDEPNPADEPSKKYQALKKESGDLKAKTIQAKILNDTRQKDLTDARALRTAAASAGRSGSINVNIEPNLERKSLDAASIEYVSKAVSKIVEDTLSLGFGREVCTTLYGQIAAADSAFANTAIDENTPIGKLVSTCMTNLAENANIYKANSAYTTSQAQALDVRTAFIKQLITEAIANKTSMENILEILKKFDSQATKEGVLDTPPPYVQSPPYQVEIAPRRGGLKMDKKSK